MSVTSDDKQWMSRALQLAERGRYTAKPNPCVGCVIVADGVLIGEGWHHKAGLAHAEVNALASAAAKASGATAYVTLEPCNHQGRTGPCTQALISAGVSRVVFAMQDPNPLVAGQGLEVLRQAGISVDGPLLEAEARSINPGFISRMERQRPWVRCKMATSMDGRTAMASGESQWITGPAARADVQRWRAQSSAIVTGINSVLLDDSRLTLRRGELHLPEFADLDSAFELAPLRVVLDSQLRIPLDAAILSDEAETLVLTLPSTIEEQAEKVAALRALGSHIKLEAVAANSGGELCLQALLDLLAKRECNEVLLETGATLAGGFLRSDLIDELIIYQAPVLMGSDARPMMALPLENMAEKKNLLIIDRCDIGQDQRILARFD